MADGRTYWVGSDTILLFFFLVFCLFHEVWGFHDNEQSFLFFFFFFLSCLLFRFTLSFPLRSLPTLVFRDESMELLQLECFGIYALILLIRMQDGERALSYVFVFSVGAISMPWEDACWRAFRSETIVIDDQW